MASLSRKSGPISAATSSIQSGAGVPQPARQRPAMPPHQQAAIDEKFADSQINQAMPKVQVSAAPRAETSRLAHQQAPLAGSGKKPAV
eukprot:8888388-Lingulodinium_polyedra.AAC.1